MRTSVLKTPEMIGYAEVVVAQTPTQFHPDLTADRLRVVADLLLEARSSALASIDRSRGDGAWVLGTMGHSRCSHSISLAADQYDWLEVVDPSLHFVFRIGSAMMRFYRGDSENPPANTLRQHYPELEAMKQMPLKFGAGDHVDGGHLRIAIETAVDGSVERLVLVKVQPGGIVDDRFVFWKCEVPVAADVIVLYPPVPLEPASVDFIEEKGEGTEDGDGGSTR